MEEEMPIAHGGLVILMSQAEHQQFSCSIREAAGLAVNDCVIRGIHMNL